MGCGIHCMQHYITISVQYFMMHRWSSTDDQHLYFSSGCSHGAGLFSWILQIFKMNLNTMHRRKCFTIFWVFIIFRHLSALVTNFGFERISGYRPALLSEESYARSRLQCTVYCSMDSKCAGFAFLWMRETCLVYVINTRMNAVRFIPEAGAKFFIKGKVLIQRKRYKTPSPALGRITYV